MTGTETTPLMTALPVGHSNRTNRIERCEVQDHADIVAIATAL
jgi:hypothetical protein